MSASLCRGATVAFRPHVDLIVLVKREFEVVDEAAITARNPIGGSDRNHPGPTVDLNLLGISSSHAPIREKGGAPRGTGGAPLEVLGWNLGLETHYHP